MLYFFHTKCVCKMGRVRSPERRVRDDDFILEYRRIVLILAEAIQGFLACALQVRISWQAQYLVKLEGDSCCFRIVNDASYVKRINHESHFSWQAPCLVKLEDDSCCSAQCK